MRGKMTVGVVAALVVAAIPASAAAPLLSNGGFEAVRAAGKQQTFTLDQSIGSCTAGTARGCWLVRPTLSSGAPAVDLVRAKVWQPASGSQSVELNSGNRAAVLAQSFD